MIKKNKIHSYYYFYNLFLPPFTEKRFCLELPPPIGLRRVKTLLETIIFFNLRSPTTFIFRVPQN